MGYSTELQFTVALFNDNKLIIYISLAPHSLFTSLRNAINISAASFIPTLGSTYPCLVRSVPLKKMPLGMILEMPSPSFEYQPIWIISVRSCPEVFSRSKQTSALMSIFLSTSTTTGCVLILASFLLFSSSSLFFPFLSSSSFFLW